MNKQINYVGIVIKKMCNMVGADYRKINFKGNKWFMKYSWTEEQQEEFKKWMEDYLYKSSDARRGIMIHNIKNKKIIKETVAFFVFNYGWKFKLTK